MRRAVDPAGAGAVIAGRLVKPDKRWFEPCPRGCRAGYLPGGAFCDCWPGQKAREKEERERAEMRAALRANLEAYTRRQLDQLGPLWTDATLETSPLKARTARGHAAWNEVMRWAQAFEAYRDKNLILCGPTGTGKTGLMVGLYKAWVPQFMQVFGRMRFLSAPDLLDHLRDGIDGGELDRRMDDLKECALLALDDVGSEKLTEWGAERLHLIIDYRYRFSAPLWVSTNLLPAELERHLGQRTYSRLVNHKASLLTVPGGDMRVNREVKGG